MKQKRIFRKKSKKNLYIFLLILLIILIFCITYLYVETQNESFFIKENTDNFYIIPLDKKGKIIPNKNIRILDYKNIKNENNEKIIQYNYSIQLYASSNYNMVLKKYDYLLNNLNLIKNKLYIVALKHNLGIDYLLVYNNFKSSQESLNYCKESLKFIQNCLIVNIQDLK